MSGGVGKAGKSNSIVGGGGASNNGLDQVLKLFQEALGKITDEEEKKELQDAMKRIQQGKGTKEDFEKVAKLLGMTEKDLEEKTGLHPVEDKGPDSDPNKV